MVCFIAVTIWFTLRTLYLFRPAVQRDDTPLVDSTDNPAAKVRFHSNLIRF